MNTGKSIGTSTFKSFLLLSITVLLLGLAATSFDSVIKYNQECKRIRDTYISSQENLFRFHVTEAVKDIEYRIDYGNHPPGELQKIFLDYLSTIRFPNHGENPGFFFVRSKDGTVLMSSSTPELVGSDLSYVPGPDGIVTHQLFLRTLVRGDGEGFADYSWYNPDTEEVEKKRSFIKEIPSWNAYIGAGFWYSDIEKEIQNRMHEFRGLIFYRVILVLGVILLFVILSMMSSKLLMRKLNKNFLLFDTFFQQAKETAATIDTEQLEYREFQNLAKTANEMSAERNASTESLKKALDEKTVLIKELFHRTKNNMQLINSLINLHTSEVTDEKALRVFKDIQNKIIAMSLVHDKLYHSDNLSIIQLNDYTFELAENIKNAYSSKLNCQIMYELDEVKTLIDYAVPFGLVLNELITNAMKHAFSDTPNPKIWISLQKKQDNAVQLAIRDNGTGLPNSGHIKESSSLGLALVVSLVETQLKGQIDFDGSDGFLCTILFHTQGYEERVESGNF